MQLHQLQRNKKAKNKKRVGRGGARGKTAGRGNKGQKARAGHRIRPEIRDAIKKIPKKRGYRFTAISVKPVPVNLSSIDKVFLDGDNITPKILIEKSIIKRQKGRIPKVKILATGKLSKKVNISGCAVSEVAKEQIKKEGGTVVFNTGKDLLSRSDEEGVSELLHERDETSRSIKKQL